MGREKINKVRGKVVRAETSTEAAEILVLRVPVLPSEVHRIQLASGKSNDAAVRASLKRIGISGPAEVAARYLVHKEIGKAVCKCLLDMLPRFPFGSHKGFVRAPAKEIDERFHEIASKYPKQTELTTRCFLQLIEEQEMRISALEELNENLRTELEACQLEKAKYLQEAEQSREALEEHISAQLGKRDRSVEMMENRIMSLNSELATLEEENALLREKLEDW